MSPTTVLYVANSAKVGGGAKVLMDLITRLDAHRYVPQLVIPGPGVLADWAKEQGVPCHLSADGDWSSAPQMIRRSLHLLSIIARTKARIVHAAAPMCYRAAGLAARMAGAARVCHLGFPPAEGELERSFLASPDAVIACYESQADDHAEQIRRIAPAARTIAIPNGVDLDRFHPMGSPGEDVQRWRFGARHVIAILGHVSEVKGYPEFVDAAGIIARTLPDCAFVAIGGETAHPGFLEQTRLRVSRAGLGERFHFIGFQDDVAPVLRAIDVVTLPSLSEGLPLAVLEAMACARPVVASAVGGVPEAIVDGESGVLIAPRNPEHLADALLALLKEPRHAHAMGLAARRRVEERFSLTRFAARVQELYRSLEQRPSAAGIVAGQVSGSAS